MPAVISVDVYAGGGAGAVGAVDEVDGALFCGCEEVA